MPSAIRWIRETLRRLRFQLRREQHAVELDEEMRFHLELKARDNERLGMTVDEARVAAKRQFGNVTRLREATSAVMTIRWLETLGQDVRYAIRSLRGGPAFSVVAIGSLALGIGAATAIFTLVNAMLLRPLPFPAPEQLVVPFRTLTPGIFMRADTMPWTYARFLALRDAVPGFASAGFASWDEVNVRRAGAGLEAAPERITMEFVTPELFTTLGAQPQRGRVFTAADDATGSAGMVAVVSDRLWRRTLSADSAVIGTTIAVGGARVTVVGVMPPSFSGFRDGAEAWIPIGAMAAILPTPESRRGSPDFRAGVVVARLRAGTTVAMARAQVAAAAQRLDTASPEPFGARDAVRSAGMIPLADARRHPLVDPLLTLFAVAVGGLLLIVCANVAGLLLARARARRSELGVRIALGAGRHRLTRQLLTESLLLAALGTVPGLLLGQAGALAIASSRPALPASFILLRDTDLLEGVSLAPDWRVGVFVVVLSVVVGFAFGAAPALAGSREGIGELLKLGGSSRGSARARGRGAMVVAQVAVATTLLVGAGLTIRSFRALVRTDLGFDPAGLAILRVAGGDSGPAAPARRAEYLARIAALPGVEAVAMHNCVPFAGDCIMGPVARLDDQRPERGEYPPIEIHVVSADYLAVMRTPLVAGRALDAGDRAGAPGVILVNQAAARLLWRGISPLGRQLAATMDPDAPPSRVVGVVGDARFEGIDQPVRPAIYVSALQWAAGNQLSVLLVRTRHDPSAAIPAIRREISAVDPGVAVHGVTTGRALVGDAASSLAFISALLTGFAACAAFLAALGLYGVLAYMVTQRTREFGIRMAIGASRRSVLTLVFRQGVLLTVTGLGAGLIAAVAATGVLTRFLYGVGRGDLLTYAGIVTLVVTVGVIAAIIPARRATRVDPVLALRE